MNANKKETIIKEFVNKKNDNGDTAIAYAAYRGNIEIIKALVEYGADINVLTNTGQGVLHIAAQGDQPESIIFFKEKYKFSMNSRDFSGSTPLHWACHTGSELSLNFLMAFGADVNSQDDVGVTPLHLGAISEKSRIIKKLIQFGADKKLKDNSGRTPYDLAKERNKFAVLDLLQDNSSLATNFLCLEQPIKKSDKSNNNIIYFILMHLIIEGIAYVTVLPCND